MEEVEDESETVAGEGGTEVCGSPVYSLTFDKEGNSTSISSERLSAGDCGSSEREGSEACLVGSPRLRDWRMASRLLVSSH